MNLPKIYDYICENFTLDITSKRLIDSGLCIINNYVDDKRIRSAVSDFLASIGGVEKKELDMFFFKKGASEE